MAQEWPLGLPQKELQANLKRKKLRKEREGERWYIERKLRANGERDKEKWREMESERKLRKEKEREKERRYTLGRGI